MRYEMRRETVLVAGVVAAGALLVSTAGLTATWKNAHVQVEDARLGLGWSVTDDAANANKYSAHIAVTVPDGAEASVQKKAPNEHVEIGYSAALNCGSDGIEIKVVFRIEPEEGASGSGVSVRIAKVAGQKPDATGDVIAEGAGGIGEDIAVATKIPGSCD